MNAPKRIGTAAETAVVRFCVSLGLPAERLALAGSRDVGDVRITPSIHAEVKAGNMAHSASIEQCHRWLLEAEREAENAGVPTGLLVVKRRGAGSLNVARWRAFVRVGPVPMEAMFSDMLTHLLGAGWALRRPWETDPPVKVLP